MEKIKYEIHCSENLKRERLIKKELHHVYNLYMGQCSDDVKSVLKEHKEYDEMIKNKDVFLLRQMLLNLSVGFKSTKQPVKTLFVCLREYMTIRQEKGESNDVYHKRFKSLKNTVHELIGGEDEPYIYAYVSLLKMHCASLGIQDSTKLDPATMGKYMALQQAKMEAMHFILGSDQDRYGGMIQDFDRAYLTGVDKYPVDLTKAYNLLNHWNGDTKKKKKNPNDIETGVSFNQVGDQDSAGNERTKCDRCGRFHLGTCNATKHADGRVLHISGSGSAKGTEPGGDDDDQVSTCPESNAPESDCDVYCSDIMEALIFVQSNIDHSGKDQRRSNHPSKNKLWSWIAGHRLIL